jgi:proteasome chaperone 1
MLDDEDDHSDEAILPTIELNGTVPETVQYVVVCPHNLKVLTSNLGGESIGSIEIFYPEINAVQEPDDTVEEDYDEDEQLYNAMFKSSLAKKFPSTSIPVVLLDSKSIVLTIPYFSNAITYNVLAKFIISSIKCHNWLTLAPATLNNDQTLNKLYVDNELNNINLRNVPNLTPPHFVTGISAAVVSQLNLTNHPNYAMIVLQSEGQPGFEKSDSDAIVDAAYTLSSLLLHNSHDYVAAVSLVVRKFNPYSNSGMYL